MLQGERKPKEPVISAGPPFPEELAYLWDWFSSLRLGLAANGFGPPVVTWEAIRAWQVLVGVDEVEPWEAETLVQLGLLRAAINAEQRPKRTA